MKSVQKMGKKNLDTDSELNTILRFRRRGGEYNFKKYEKEFKSEKLVKEQRLKLVKLHLLKKEDISENLASMADENLIQDLEEEKKQHGRLFPSQINIERKKSLKKRTPERKLYHKRKKKKKKKKKKRKLRRKGLRKHSRKRKGRNEMNAFNYQKGFKIQRQNHCYPKKLISTLTRPKFKRFSSFEDVIEYLKSNKHSKVNENCEICETCENCGNCASKYCKDKIRRRLGNHALKQLQNFNVQKSNKLDKSKIHEEEDKRQIKRSPFSNFKRRNNIHSQNADCENDCENKNLDVGSCSCKNGKPVVDFEKQLKLLNKGGEEVEATKEKPGFFNKVQNFLKNTLNHNEVNCTLATTLNPYQSQNQNITISETTLVTISEINSEIYNEFNNEVNNGINNGINNETSSVTSFSTSNRIFEYEDNTEVVTEEMSSCFETETLRIVITTGKEIIPTETPTIELDNNKCLTTTSIPFNSSKLCIDNEESNTNSLDDKKCKKPVATFTLEIKANPVVKKKSFRIKMKY